MALPVELWKMILEFKTSHYLYERKKHFDQVCHRMETLIAMCPTPFEHGPFTKVRLSIGILIYYHDDTDRIRSGLMAYSALSFYLPPIMNAF